MINYTRNLISIVSIVGLIVILSGCWEPEDWSNKRKIVFKKQCDEKNTIENPQFILSGFNLQMTDSIIVKETLPNNTVDSFSMFSQSSNNSRNADFYPKRNLIKSAEYQLTINNEIFIVTNLTTKMNPEFTMGSKDYGCHLTSYRVNGKLYEDYGHIFIER